MDKATDDLKYDHQIKQWIEQEMNNDAIFENFKKMGLDHQKMEEIEALVKKIRNKKRTHTGSILVLIGVVILGLGFISCIILHYLGLDINFSLYGLTGIGAVVLIVGLILIFN